jgi:hypothetical protein
MTGVDKNSCPLYTCEGPAMCPKTHPNRIEITGGTVECPLYHCCPEVTEPTTVPTTTTTTVQTTTTTQCSFCLDEEDKQRIVNGESWTHAKDCCVTRSCKTDGHNCYIEDDSKSCPEPLKCKKGEFLSTTADKYCLNGNCCPTEECLPCKCCTDKELDCPKIEEVKCNKCQVQKLLVLSKEPNAVVQLRWFALIGFAQLLKSLLVDHAR